MGLKRISQTTYVTDRGIELAVEEMETTHLVNAICHHQKQVDVLKQFAEDPNGNLAKRVDSLNETINTLLDELEKRDPARDHEDDTREVRRRFSNEPPYG